MTHPLEPQLERMAELLDRVGADVLLRAPLVLPDDRWFPDRWTPDLESARRLLFRLAEYAGMPDLGVEVALVGQEDLLPDLGPRVKRPAPRARVLGEFHGIADACAWFRVNGVILGDPRTLVGTLAHEMAHAWRARRQVAIEDGELEEQLTDLSTVVLGFGVLTANAAYRVWQTTSAGTEDLATTEHHRSGYLSEKLMSGLLAAFVAARGDDPGRVRRELAPTQVSDFDEASDWLQEKDLGEFLALPPRSERPRPAFTGATRRDFPIGLAGRAVHEAVVAVTGAIGDASGLVPVPAAFAFPPVFVPYTPLVQWGRADFAGGWYRALFLLADPEWATQLLVLEFMDAGEWQRVAIGHLRDRDAKDPRRLVQVIAPMFDPSAPLAPLASPALPAFLGTLDPRAVPVDRLRDLFAPVTRRFGADALAREAGWLAKFAGHAIRRVEVEMRFGGREDEAQPPADAAAAWWKAASLARHVADEVGLFSVGSVTPPE